MSFFDPQRIVSQALARKYALRPGPVEGDLFGWSWELFHRLTQSDPLAEVGLAQGAVEVEAAFGRLKAAIDGHPTDVPGHRYVLRLPTLGRKYVIFSDHHVMHAGHRQNFFGPKNVALYEHAIDAYFDAGFTLVENGDVEDLVVYDPALWQHETQIRANLDLTALKARRLDIRSKQFDLIVKSPENQGIVARWKEYASARRLIRIAGNHDYNLQRGQMLGQLLTVYPGVPRPADYLLLEQETPTGTRVAYAIMHGHQFDRSTNPLSAPRFGETISECLGTFYQGPDRTWSWADSQGWAVGTRQFRNELVRDTVTHDKPNIALLDVLIGATALELGVLPDSLVAPLKRQLRDRGQALFEWMFKHDIAWEYFANRDPFLAITDEVWPGREFFKYRHLDEEFIRDGMERNFGPTPPTIVLGHTHEPRFEPWSPTRGRTIDWFMNSGAAGRFENLLWALEIVDGKAKLVTWSVLPYPGGVAERRTWTAFTDPQGHPAHPGRLQATAHPSVL